MDTAPLKDAITALEEADAKLAEAKEAAAQWQTTVANHQSDRDAAFSRVQQELQNLKAPAE